MRPTCNKKGALGKERGKRIRQGIGFGTLLPLRVGSEDVMDVDTKDGAHRR
jgi:hypothetical protein